MKNYRSSGEAFPDVAWETAWRANQAFDELQDAEIKIAYLGTATLKIVERHEGSSYNETDLENTRQKARENFDSFNHIATIAMEACGDFFKQMHKKPSLETAAHADTPLLETVQDAPLRPLSGLSAFAQRTDKNLTGFTRWFNGLRRNAQRIALRKDNSYELTIFNKTSEFIILTSQAGEEYFDINNLRTAVDYWEACTAKSQQPDGFSKETANLVKGYLRGTSVTPDNSSEQDDLVPLSSYEMDQLIVKELPLVKQLLDEVQVGDEKLHVVTHQSLQRFAVTRGYRPSQTAGFAKFFSEMASYVMPNPARDNTNIVRRYNDVLVLAKTYSYAQGVNKTKVKLWGFDPHFFVEFNTFMAQSISLRRQIAHQPYKRRKVIEDYLVTLEELLSTNEPFARPEEE